MVDVTFSLPVSKDIRITQGSEFDIRVVWLLSDGVTPKWSSIPAGATAKSQIRTVKGNSSSPSLLSISESTTFSNPGQITFDTNGIINIHYAAVATGLLTYEYPAWWSLAVILQSDESNTVAEGRAFLNKTPIF